MEYNLDFHGRQFKRMDTRGRRVFMKFYKYDGLKMLNYVLKR